MDVTEQELQSLYTWVDEIPLSRPKRNIARDFSDGVLMAEVVHHYFPKLVELHNYSGANGLQQKLYNWNTLNGKVFKRLGFLVNKPDVEAVCNCQQGAVERVLKLLKLKIGKFKDDTNNGYDTSMPSPAYAEQSFPRHIGAAAPAPKQMAGQGFQEAFAAPRQFSAPSAGNAQTAAGTMITAKMAAVMAPEVIAEKEQVIHELKETNQILETKVRKLEQLVRLKDAKIQTLMAKLQAAGMA